MPIGTLGALAISTGASLSGQAANSLFNERPDVPDLTSEVEGKFDTARRTLEQKQDRQTEEVQSDAAAAGVNPVSAMADVIESNNQAQADLGASRADAVARAENQVKRMEFGQKKRSHQATAQGIGSIVSGISNFATNRAAINALSEDEGPEGPEDPGGGEGGGGGGAAASQGSAGGSTSTPNVNSTTNQEPTSSVDATRDQSSMGTTLASTGASGNSGTGALDAIVGGGMSFLQNVQGGMNDQTNPLMTQLAMDGAEGLLG